MTCALTYNYVKACGEIGKENDNEVKGTGNQQDYGMRIYDPRLGRFLSADPLIVQEQKYPELSPYQFASDRPIQGIDKDGLEFEDQTGNSTPTDPNVAPENQAAANFITNNVPQITPTAGVAVNNMTNAAWAAAVGIFRAQYNISRNNVRANYTNKDGKSAINLFIGLPESCKNASGQPLRSIYNNVTRNILIYMANAQVIPLPNDAIISTNTSDTELALALTNMNNRRSLIALENYIKPPTTNDNNNAQNEKFIDSYNLSNNDYVEISTHFQAGFAAYKVRDSDNFAWAIGLDVNGQLVGNWQKIQLNQNNSNGQ